MSLARYAGLAIGIVAMSLALVWPLLSAEARPATLFGAGLATANTLLAYFLAAWSEKRSPNVFLGAVLGGTVVRMALMLATVAAAILKLGLPKVPLAVSVLSYFVLFLVFELAVLQRRTTRPAIR